MKTRIMQTLKSSQAFRLVLMILLLAALLASSATPQRSAAQGASQVVVASGGHYHLTTSSNNQTVRVSAGIISGGGYQLQGPSYPASTGTGCCCTFLPCVRR